jgi:hypothetical protein
MPTAPPPEIAAHRLGSAAIGAVLTGLAAYLAWHNLRLAKLDGWIFWLPLALWFLTMGLLRWWAALGSREATTQTRIAASWRTGWVVGAVGLALGFVGPLLITPSANLGPLLGILITGPGGFVLGALGGGIFGSWAGGAATD